jgi:mannopine transport system permease protein
MAGRVVKRTMLSSTASARHYSVGASLLLCAPLVLLLLFAFIYPVGKLILESFATRSGFTFEHYGRLVHEPLYARVLWRTLEISLVVTILALLLGYPVALAMARAKGRWAIVITACVLISLWTAVLVRSYAWIVLLQRNGVINNLLREAGLTSEPLRLLYTEGAVIMAMAHILLPFMILPIFAGLRTIPDDLVRAARNLGATGFKSFLQVVLPLSLPGIYAGALMTFILALGFYVTPALVGGPRTLMMATLIGQQTTELLNWPFAGALSVLLLGSTLLIVIIFRNVLARNQGMQIGG